MDLTLRQKIELQIISYQRDTIKMNQLALKYFPKATIENFYVKKTDTECLFIKVETTCIIVFPGTESIKDFLIDLFFWSSDYKYGGKIHSGFNSVANAMEDSVILAASNLFSDEQPKKIIIIGHSLGAQCAMLAADILYFENYKNIEITTFGCPNGWNQLAQTLFQSRHSNVTHVHNPFDYVTKMLGILSGRPWKKEIVHNIFLKGAWGHKIKKYKKNIKRLNEKRPKKIAPKYNKHLFNT